MQNASSTTKQLYLFLTACSGNWRNSIYIKCQSDKDDPGYLLAADRDGQPVILGVRQFSQLTGVWIDLPSVADSSPRRGLSLCMHNICSGDSLRRKNIH